MRPNTGLGAIVPNPDSVPEVDPNQATSEPNQVQPVSKAGAKPVADRGWSGFGPGLHRVWMRIRTGTGRGVAQAGSYWLPKGDTLREGLGDG